MWGRSLVPGAPRGRSRLEPPLRAWGGEIGGDTGEMQGGYLPLIFRSSPLHAPCRAPVSTYLPISPLSRLYLAYISPISRLYLAYISTISPPYLACERLGQHAQLRAPPRRAAPRRAAAPGAAEVVTLALLAQRRQPHAWLGLGARARG